jgi:prolyl oligopeptidase
MKKHWQLPAIGVALLTLVMAPGADPIKYPATKRDKTVDELHGVRVADPYRWLEQDVRESKAVRAWVEAENKVTSAYLDAIPQREAIRKRLTQLWNYERYSAPFKEGRRYFYFHNNGLQNQPVLYTTTGLGEKGCVLLDPNALSKEGVVALMDWAVSDDGRQLAYGLAEGGSDWRTWRVRDVETGEDRKDQVKWVKFSSASWTKDGKGFFYSRYDEPTKGTKFTALNLNQKVYYHKVGTPQAEDRLVYSRPDHPRWGFSASVSDDGRYLVLSTWQGTDRRNRFTYQELRDPDAKSIDLVNDFENEYTFLDNVGPVFYVRTDLDAPRRRVIAIDTRKPAREAWKEVIPQAKEPLTAVSVVGDQFICTYLKDAKSQVKVYKLDGTFVRDIGLPGIGTATGFSGKRSDKETFYTFSSFATPPIVFRYNTQTGNSTVLRRARVKFDPEKYTTEQVFYTSKDGTRVPMFLTYGKGLKKDGDNPTLLYGYGGFNISLTPNFNIARVAWLEMGGVYAQANLRGGGEYGKAWHKAGTKLHKKNVFDDFIAAAEYVIAEKWTNRKRLAIQGRSNGGLLVGAAMTRRPDLFGVCLPAVGVMDMLRFHKFTAGRFWVDDYGSPENPGEFEALRAYSPYHNLKMGTKYPATLVTTADHDDRVVPGHTFKFLAKLQYCQAGSAPVLGRIETKAGHGAGKPTEKAIAEVVDEYAFLVKNLGMEAKGLREGGKGD